MSRSRPIVFQYWDYRQYLLDTVDFLRSQKKYSARSFAKAAGLGSSGYLSMILKRQRNLGAKAARKLCLGLGLGEEEAKFLQRLIAFNQEMDFETKDKLYRDLLRSKSFEKIRKIDNLQYEFLSKWYFMALFEALAKPMTIAEISHWAESLGITIEQAREGLRLLEKLDFAEKMGDEWHRKELIIQTDPHVSSLANRNFHRQMISKALDSLDAVEPKEREIGALTIALSKEKFEEVRKLIFKFQEELNTGYSNDPNPEAVYQFNLQLFPLGRWRK